MEKSNDISPPLVSVIMLSFNSMATIEDAVQCIIDQTYHNWELIISDGASTDGTQDWLRKLNHPQIRVVLNETRQGYIRDKNNTFKLAKGALLTQLDSDDLCPPNRLELQVNTFLQHPEIRIVAGNFRLIDMDGNVLPGAKDYEADFLINEVQPEYPFWFAAVMMRKELFEEFGYFSEYFIGLYGDDDYWATRVNVKYPIYFIKEPIYFYRANPNSITNVFDNPRKLIVSNVILELKRQQMTNGTDWLAEGKEELMKEFEHKLLTDKKIMGEKYRIWAAKAVDVKDFKQSGFLLKEAFKLNPWNPDLYKTLIYYLRSR